MVKPKHFSIILCIILAIFSSACSFTNSSNTPLQASTPSPMPTLSKLENTLSLEELVEQFNNEIAAMSAEDRKEADLEGINLKLKVKDDDVIVLQFTIDGFAGLVFNAANGNVESLNEYDEMLVINKDEAKTQTEEFQKIFTDEGYNISNIEYWIMNDINPENTLVIIKNGQVVFDTVYGINLIDLGSQH